MKIARLKLTENEEAHVAARNKWNRIMAFESMILGATSSLTDGSDTDNGWVFGVLMALLNRKSAGYLIMLREDFGDDQVDSWMKIANKVNEGVPPDSTPNGRIPNEENQDQYIGGDFNMGKT